MYGNLQLYVSVLRLKFPQRYCLYNPLLVDTLNLAVYSRECVHIMDFYMRNIAFLWPSLHFSSLYICIHTHRLRTQVHHWTYVFLLTFIDIMNYSVAYLNLKPILTLTQRAIPHFGAEISISVPTMYGRMCKHTHTHTLPTANFVQAFGCFQARDVFTNLQGISAHWHSEIISRESPKESQDVLVPRHVLPAAQRFFLGRLQELQKHALVSRYHRGYKITDTMFC